MESKVRPFWTENNSSCFTHVPKPSSSAEICGEVSCCCVSLPFMSRPKYCRWPTKLGAYQATIIIHFFLSRLNNKCPSSIELCKASSSPPIGATYFAFCIFTGRASSAVFPCLYSASLVPHMFILSTVLHMVRCERRRRYTVTVQ